MVERDGSGVRDVEAAKSTRGFDAAEVIAMITGETAEPFFFCAKHQGYPFFVCE